MTYLSGALLALCMLCASCAATQLGSGSPRWRKVTTEHFTVYTDLPEAEALHKAEEFERWLSAFLQHGWQVTGKLPLRLNVVVFRWARDFHRHADLQIGGYAVPNVLLEPWIVMPHEREARALENFRHELTHYISRLAMYHQPAWFAEGVASYFESAYFDDEGRLALGAVSRDRAEWLARHWPLPARQLFASDANRRSQGFYASAWLLVHYLMSEQSEAFDVYQVELARGRAHPEAWSIAFPTLGLDELDEQARAYMRRNQFAVYLLPVSAKPGTGHARNLSRADELALQGILWASRCADCPPGRGRVLADQSFAAALKEDLNQPQAAAWALLTNLYAHDANHADVLAAEALVRANPEEWLTWMTLGLLAVDAGEYERVRAEHDPVAKLIKLVPDYPYTRFLAAFQYAAEGNRDAAIREGERARRLGSSNPDLLWLQADLLSRLPACRELADTIALLHELNHGEPIAPAQQAVYDRLERECRLRDAATKAAAP